MKVGRVRAVLISILFKMTILFNIEDVEDDDIKDDDIEDDDIEDDDIKDDDIKED